MSKKAVMRLLANKEGWYCRYCRCKLLPIPEYELIYENGNNLPIVRRVRWNLETMIMPLGYASPTVDHVIPKCKKGTSEINNLVLACQSCNKEKADLPYDDFFKSKEAVRRLNKNKIRR